MDTKREQWSSKLGFILATAGAAIGLGAIWKFPYVAGMNGGGAFFLIFIVFTVVIGLSMLISEFVIGRGAKKEAISAYKKLAPNSFWVWVGRLGVIGCFLLLSFYSVVGGWVLLYSGLAVSGNIIHDGADYGQLFGQVTSTPWMGLLGLALFLLINVIVLSFGIKNGIEKASKYLMPLLFVFFIVLVFRSLTLEGAMEGVRFFLKPDFSSITGESILYALGQSFFSLAVGFSCMVTYSSYLDKKVSIPSAASSVVFMNIFVSLLAGLAIFPVVFSFGLEPAEGPGLLFMVLPTAFSQMPFGSVFLSLFLLLFLFATLTSSFSLLEIIISAFIEDGKRSRKKVAFVSGIIIFIAGIPAALSFGVLQDVLIFGQPIFDATDYLVSNILLPLGSLLIALFITHRMDQQLVSKEFQAGNSLSTSWFSTWKFLMRWIVPLTITIVFINMIGLF
ncbi:sodium-dependent transporter [Halalkalibacter krulwichiae]|uniref:Transporter n=1 Tax=Halalkalibacter krulwichiae TaxID=199441 RepID=A0A1X9MD19_9BACI|nr:sodium-dependent transporter [Halalkalibacter krulwichiae]ARK30023.1 Sodium:neurotransmitter symporter family protein [Halalkalibacter krulwichiae]